MRRSSSAVVLLGALGLVGCTMTHALSTSAGSSQPSGPDHGASDKLVMPDLTGKTPDAASTELREAGFEPSFEVNRILLECDAPRTTGRIRCQSPDAGALVDRHAIINVNVEEGPTVIHGALVRAQLEKLRGMTIAAARAYLERLGHDGAVAIFEQPTFSDSCGVQRVCAVEPEAGTGIHDRITLVVNPSSNVDIALPP